MFALALIGLATLCGATKIDLSDGVLPYNLSNFCAIYYDSEFLLLDGIRSGDDWYGGVPNNQSWTTSKIDKDDWTSHWNIYADSGIEGNVEYDGQECVLGDGGLVYGVPTEIDIYGLYSWDESGFWLTIYDMSTHQYVNMSWYNAELPYQAESSCLVIVDEMVYVLGGSESYDTVDRVQVYDIANDAWSTLSSMSNARESHGCAAVGQYIYVLGGEEDYDELTKGTIEEYDIANDAWSTMDAEIEDGKEYLECQAYEDNDEIFCFEGLGDYEHYKKVLVYDTKKDEMITSCLTTRDQRWYHETVLAGDDIYVLGGYSGFDGLVNMIESMDAKNFDEEENDCAWGEMQAVTFGVSLFALGSLFCMA